MADLLSWDTVKTKKKHRCFGCNRVFPAGTTMQKEDIAEDGTVWHCYLCETCAYISDSLGPDDLYSPGDLLDDALRLESEVEYG